MNLLVYNKKLLKAHNAIRDMMSNLLEKGFDNEPVYDSKYIRTKVKSYNGEINTNFYGNKIPEKGEYYACLSVILLDSVVEVGKNIINKHL